MEKSVVSVIDDDQSLCQSIKYLLDSIKVDSKIYYSPDAFLDEYDQSRPGCLLLDIRMPNISGLQLQQLLTNKKINIPIIFMTGHGDIATAVRAMKKGAFDFFTKPFNHDLLLEAIQNAISYDLKKRGLEKNYHKLISLTVQELHILELIASGKSSKIIAEILNLSAKTIEYHRSKIMRKLDAKNLAQLMEAYCNYKIYKNA